MRNGPGDEFENERAKRWARMRARGCVLIVVCCALATSACGRQEERAAESREPKVAAGAPNRTPPVADLPKGFDRADPKNLDSEPGVNFINSSTEFDYPLTVGIRRLSYSQEQSAEGVMRDRYSKVKESATILKSEPVRTQKIAGAIWLRGAYEVSTDGGPIRAVSLVHVRGTEVRDFGWVGTPTDSARVEPQLLDVIPTIQWDRIPVARIES